MCNKSCFSTAACLSVMLYCLSCYELQSEIWCTLFRLILVSNDGAHKLLFLEICVCVCVCLCGLSVFTSWSRVLLEKLTGFQLVKKLPAFFGSRMFITAFKSPRHLSLSWASSIQSTPPHLTSWSSILILSSHLRLGLPSGLFPSGFPTKTLLRLSSPACALRAPPISFFSILSPEQNWVGLSVLVFIP